MWRSLLVVTVAFVSLVTLGEAPGITSAQPADVVAPSVPVGVLGSVGVDGVVTVSWDASSDDVNRSGNVACSNP